MTRPKAGRNDKKARNSFHKKMLPIVAKYFGIKQFKVADAARMFFKGSNHEAAEFLTWAKNDGSAIKVASEFKFTPRAQPKLTLVPPIPVVVAQPEKKLEQPVVPVPVPGEMSYTKLSKHPRVISLVVVIVHQLSGTNYMPCQDIMEMIRVTAGWEKSPWQALSRVLASIARQGYLVIEVKGSRSYAVSKKAALEVLKLSPEECAVKGFLEEKGETKPKWGKRQAKQRIAELERELDAVKKQLANREADIEKQVTERVTDSFITGGAQRITELLEGKKNARAILDSVEEKIKGTFPIGQMGKKVWDILQDYPPEHWQAILNMLA